MKYRFLGKTGIKISEISLGTMTFGDNPKWGLKNNLSKKDMNIIINRAIDSGINFFDTADVYANGFAEKVLGKGIKSKRSELIIATKVKGRSGDGINQIGLSRIHIINQINNSLKNLQTDYIDLYQIHSFDPFTSMEETIVTLNDLVRSGKVRYIGVSNIAAWQLVKYIYTAKIKNLEEFCSIQLHYSLIDRGAERELIPMIKDLNLGLLIWSPLSGGFLSSKFRADKKKPVKSRMSEINFPPINYEKAYKIKTVLTSLAKDTNYTEAQIALAWSLHNESVTSIIIGVKSIEQLNENLCASDISLTKEQLNELNNASVLTLEYPTWYINRNSERN